jgi:hypothetical protein
MKPFAQLSGQEKGGELLRWLVVPVAAVVAVYVLLLISRVAMPPAMARLPGTPAPPVTDFQRIAPRIFGVLMAALFVLAGAKVAPRWRLMTALVLAGLWIGFSFSIHIFVHLGRGTPNYLDFALAVFAASLAAGLIGYAEQRCQNTP